MSGMKIVTVSTDAQGNVNVQELKQKAEENKDKLAALMITYPSTHGEENKDKLAVLMITYSSAHGELQPAGGCQPVLVWWHLWWG